MSTINFNTVSDTFQGIDKVALRVSNGAGGYAAPVAWNGVTALNESPSGAEPTKLYADNENYITLTSKEELALTLECYCTPSAFDACDGTEAISGAHGLKIGMQERKTFALVYHEKVIDQNGEKGFGKYHIVIGCKAAPTSRDHATINDSPEASTLSYEINTTPAKVSFATGVSLDEAVHLVIDATTGYSATTKNALEEALYGTTAAWTATDGVLSLATIYSATV